MRSHTLKWTKKLLRIPWNDDKYVSTRHILPVIGWRPVWAYSISRPNRPCLSWEALQKMDDKYHTWQEWVWKILYIYLYVLYTRSRDHELTTSLKIKQIFHYSPFHGDSGYAKTNENNNNYHHKYEISTWNATRAAVAADHTHGCMFGKLLFLALAGGEAPRFSHSSEKTYEKRILTC